LKIKIMDVRNALKNAQDFLSKSGVPDAKASAEVLLSDALKVERSKLAVIGNEIIADESLHVFNEYILRRSKREPCAYITGSCEFFGYEFKVNENVLIPRPETENLVEEVLKSGGNSVLDLCAGSGCIAVALAKSGKFKEVLASDISPKALDIAKFNAKANGAEIIFLISDIFEDIGQKKFDIIVSNPPYVSDDEYLGLEPELMFEPKLALETKDGGLFFYKQIAGQAKNYLNSGGEIFVELNANKPKEIRKIFEDEGFKNIKIVNDYSNLPRILKASF